MALGAVTVVRKGVVAPGGLRFVILNVQPTTGANYTANGESFPLSLFPKFTAPPMFVQASPQNEASGASYLVYEPSTQKLLAFDSATGVEEAGSQDLSAMSFRVFALGI